ncbi:MAG: T9SS type A sorting domain-containing protein [Bacteroidales bacterium]|nr:T9SS type A sorting domain-containing protein [Bacteroidales bacterium]
MKKLFPVFFSLLLFFLIPKANLNGQNGAWVEQPTGSETASNQFLEGGMDCIGYAKKNSRYIYFFDVNIHQWTTVDLQTEQVFKGMKADSRVIMAYTNEFIIGYSSITSTYDTLRYEGTPLYPNTNDPFHRSYGCIEKAAYFATYTHFYVFDAELGIWQQFPYPAHPYDDGAIIFLRGNNYIGMIIPNHGDPDNIVTNLAYSLPKHNASSHSSAGYPDNPVIMADGFVTTLFNDEHFAILTGYCSATNSFSQIVLNELEDGDVRKGLWTYPDKYNRKTVMAYTQRKLKADGFVHQNFYGYNTTRGSWDAEYNAYSYKPNEESGYLVFLQGGSVAGVANQNYVTDELSMYAYYGNTGVFHNLGPGIVGASGAGHSPQCANDILLAYDTTKVWIYNPYMTDAHIANGFFDNLTDFVIGDQFIAVNIWDPTKRLSKDKFHIYNTETNHATVIELEMHHNSIYPYLTKDFFAFIPPLADKREVWFYSGLLDSLSHVTFSMGNQAYNVDVKGRIGAAFSDSGLETFLYDANTGALTLLNTNFSSSELGGNYFMFKEDETMHVYNFTKQEFSQVQVNNMGNFWAGDTVGLVTDAQKKNFYAYNGYTNAWVPLAAEGYWTYNTGAFGKTAVVVRQDRLYAFDPFLVSGIDETNLGDDNSFELMQNRPNPFSGTTEISYALARSGLVSLKIYDLFGNQVALLVDENKQPGEYKISYQPAGLSEGVYYYTLTFNNRLKTRKMVLVR